MHEVNKLSNREVPVGDEYNETHEERQEERLRKLTKRALRLHEYLIRKGRIVDSNGQKLWVSLQIINTLEKTALVVVRIMHCLESGNTVIKIELRKDWS